MRTREQIFRSKWIEVTVEHKKLDIFTKLRWMLCELSMYFNKKKKKIVFFSRPVHCQVPSQIAIVRRRASHQFEKRMKKKIAKYQLSGSQHDLLIENFKSAALRRRW